jgi:hypothetical protein
MPGGDGLASNTPALGGASPSNGGNGGNGAAGVTPALDGFPNGGSPNNGGGGAGGGLGRIRINASQACTFATSGLVLSPAPTSNGAAGCP